jgi:hypothetical protein
MINMPTSPGTRRVRMGKAPLGLTIEPAERPTAPSLKDGSISLWNRHRGQRTVSPRPVPQTGARYPMAQVQAAQVSGNGAASSFDQIASVLDDIVNVLERIARAVEATAAVN